MRVRLSLLTYFIVTMSLRPVLKALQQYVPNVNHREVLVKTLFLAPKLAHNLERLSFLVACRKAHVFPKFIEDIMKSTAFISESYAFERKKKRFCADMLNEAIKETFRKQAFLLREKKRLDERGLQAEQDIWTWLQDRCRAIFQECRNENRAKLMNKFRQLQSQQRRSALPEDDSRVNHCSARQNDVHCAQPSASHDAERKTAANLHSREDRSFKNLSTLQLNDNLVDLLNCGPKFALTRQVNRDVLREVESGLERGAYALRWKAYIDNKRGLQAQPPPNPHSPSEEQQQQEQRRQQQRRHQQQQQQQQQQQEQQQQEEEEEQRQQQSLPPPPVPHLKQPLLHQDRQQHQQSQQHQGSEPRHRHQQTSDPNCPASQSSQLMPRFPDGDCSQAPPGNKAMEDVLQQVKKKVTAAYKTHTRPSRNHTGSQLSALQELARNKDIVVKPSDKCKGLVLLDAKNYVEKIEITTSGYEAVPRNPTPRLEATTKRVIHSTMDNKVDERVIKAIIPHCSRTAELYGLPKDHKENIPLRPIVSACDDPVDKLTWFLERVITQLMPHVPAHLKNTTQFLDKLRSQYPLGFEQGTIIFSIDVVNLYGNIPPSEAIEATMTLLHHHRQDINTFGLELDNVRPLLEHCLKNSYVRFGHNYFRQSQGIAMGSRVAPPQAIVFMHALETMFLAAARLQPSLYVRYIDDVFGVWTHGKANLLDYFIFLNTIHPTIKFTIEHSGDTGELAFLDSKIVISASGNYSSELYVKPMASPVIINFHSALPMRTKKNTVRSQMLRAIRLSSPGLPRARSLKTMEDLFIKNGYPPHLVQRLKNETLRRKNNDTYTKNEPPPVNLALPFIDDALCHKIEGIIKASRLNVRVAWRGGPNLKQKLVRSAHLPTPCPGGGRTCNCCEAGLRGRCHTKNVVYRMDCKLCQKDESFYIGETRRSVRLRYNEHIRDAKNKRLDTPLGLHQTQHPGVQLDSSNVGIQILHVCKDGPDRKIWESMFIRDLEPTLNVQTTSWAIL